MRFLTYVIISQDSGNLKSCVGKYQFHFESMPLTSLAFFFLSNINRSVLDTIKSVLKLRMSYGETPCEGLSSYSVFFFSI